MNIEEIIDLIYKEYIDNNMVFNHKLFKEQHEDLYEILINNFDNINDIYIYLSINKTNNNLIRNINELKNFLLLQYLDENKINGRTYSDLIKGTKFTLQQISMLYKCLNKYV